VDELQNATAPEFKPVFPNIDPPSLREFAGGTATMAYIKNKNAAKHRLVFFLLSCRSVEVDWRVALFDELRDQADFCHVYLGRKSILTNTLSGEVRTYSVSELPRLVRDTRREADGKRPIYFVSMATALPSLVIMLRLLLRNGIWLFDVYDDFSLYWGSSLYRFKGHIVNSIFPRLFTATIIAPPNLIEKFPDAYALEIASNIKPVSHGSFDSKKLIVTSNIDPRLDYDFLTAVAQRLPDTEIHVYGRATNSPNDLPRLQQIMATAANIKYYGEFSEAGLQQILSRYNIALAPFRTNALFTRSTDPSRFYDYLNAGLEVVSTDIPRARQRANFLHVARGPAEAAELCGALQTNPQLRKAARWNWEEHTWNYRSRQLLEIIDKINSQERVGQF
jgi:glycosyltransferase involved in cell wall biosynthesis